MSRTAIIFLATLASACPRSSSTNPVADPNPQDLPMLPSPDATADRPKPEPTASSPNAGRASALDGCLVLTGESKKSTRTIKLPGGATGPSGGSFSCSLDVECIKTRARTMPGDSHVSIKCEGAICGCTIERLASPKKVTRFKINIDPPCAAPERAKALLIEHCLPALKGPAEREAH